MKHAVDLTPNGPLSPLLPCSFPTASAWEPLIEVAVPSNHSRLHLPRAGGPQSLPGRFAWLVGGSICHGHLLLQV
jgi:hypothetical protein